MSTNAVLTQDFMDSVLKPFHDLKTRISEAEDCVFVQAQATTLDALHSEAYSRINNQLQTLREKETDHDEVPIPVRSTKIVKDTSIFKTRDTIKSEEELDKYLKELRASLLKLLEENDIRLF
jgi:hypothetical protein